MALVNVNSVVARSALDGRHERAWVALNVSGHDGEKLIPVASFGADQYGERAWSQAVKHAQRLSNELAVPFRKRRDMAKTPELAF